MDYQRIEKAITYLRAHFLEQPDLAIVARVVHLSEYHFQRLFTRWVGISPKRFIQFLTIEYAKRQLEASKALLEVALDSGLSSPGRLHDLFISVEAVTPGEFKTRGAGIHIDYGFHASPFGPCLIGASSRGICWLSFVNDGSRRKSLGELKTYWTGASLAEEPETTGLLASRIFTSAGKNNGSSLNLLLKGTNFQLKVWQALLGVPSGSMVSYEDLGGLVGAPNSSRAIGSAVGQNSIAYLIPCHRVIRKSGCPGGYRWGEARKLAILAWEAARAKMQSVPV